MPPFWEPLTFVPEEAEVDEQMGSKEKWWVYPDWDDRRWLLKLARLDDNDGTVSGEDWAEWAVHHLANLLALPTALIPPARLEGRRGIISRSVLRDRQESLEHGNSILSGKFPEYDQSVQGENPGYSAATVRTALEGVGPPPGGDWGASFTAFDVWAGYLLLDAWVSGRDRHHENWAVILRGDERRLAPSFDHGNALGFQERDVRRQRMLADEEHMGRWIERGTSRHFVGKPHLVPLAYSALNLASAEARAHWLDRLAAVDESDVASTLSVVPPDIMTEVTHTFVLRLLEANRRRLLDGYSSTSSPTA